MNFLDDSLAQYFTQRNDIEDANDMQPPKMPDYHLNDDNIDLEMSDQNEEINEEQNPPPSQPRPAKDNQSPPNRQKEQENSLPKQGPPKQNPPKQDLLKRDLKRKYMGRNATEANIAKTEQSIEKLEKHLTNRTCPILYNTRQNLTSCRTLSSTEKLEKSNNELNKA